MKKWTNLILVSLLAFVFSCSESSLNLVSKNDRSLSEISTKQAEFIKEDIQSTFDKKDRNVEKIVTIDRIGDFSIVEYLYNGNKKGNIALSNLHSSNAKVDAAGGSFKIWCTGPCDCGLEGESGPGNESYTQCKCTDCVMHIEISPNYPNKTNNTSDKYSVSLEDVAAKSFFDTFGKKATKVSVDKIEVDKYNDSNIFTLHYSEGSLKSTVLLITNYTFPNQKQEGPKSPKARLQQEGEPKNFTVDCHGTCDCREKFFPATGAIECTCTDCKMDVTEIKPQQP